MNTDDALRKVLSTPTVWLYLAFSLSLTIGVHFIADSETEAVVATGLGGAMSLLFIWILVRRLRPARALNANVPLGVELRSSGFRPLPIAFMAGTAGFVLLYYPGSPVLVRGIGAIFLTIAVTALLALTGHVKQQFLRIDTDGLTIGEWGYQYLIPWSAISYVTAGTYAHQPVVSLGIRAREAIRVAPGIPRLRMLWTFKRHRWIDEDMDLMVLSAQFGLQAEALRDALKAQKEKHVDG